MKKDGKYIYELYCVKEQVFSTTADNFSLIVKSSKPIRVYSKDKSSKILKTQAKLEKLLANELKLCGEQYHIVYVNADVDCDLSVIDIIDLDNLK